MLVKLEQILHLEVDCSDFGPVRDRGSLPYLITLKTANDDLVGAFWAIKSIDSEPTP